MSKIKKSTKAWRNSSGLYPRGAMQMRDFPDRYPSSEGAKLWPGAWIYGVDFAEGSNRVIAVHVGGGEIKYGLNWAGPIELTKEAMPLLMQWAEAILDVHGGYVHLFPADGDETHRFCQSQKERWEQSA